MKVFGSGFFSALAGLSLMASSAMAAPVIHSNDLENIHAGIRPEVADFIKSDSNIVHEKPKSKPKHHAATAYNGANSAPLLSATNADTAGLESHYIIILDSSISQQDLYEHTSWVGEVHQENIMQANTFYGPEDSNYMFGLKHIYDFGESAFKGYAGQFSADVVEQIRLHPHVIAVERDQVVTIKDKSTQSGAPWGLSRVSHRAHLTSETNGKYVYDSSAGDGATAYVVDTGVNIHHVEFEGRAKWGKTIPTNDADEDGNGHGTHVAGTIASRAYGVAKKAQIVAVKVLRSNGSGSMSDVISGVEWTVKDHQSKNSKKTAVANMSLGGGSSFVLDFAVDSAVKKGILYAVAAGNEFDDACYSSPAASKLAITVAASNVNDQLAYFSNYGKCVDIIAPGVNILSTWIGSNNRNTNTISGTSMATPHVAGLAAYYLGLHPDSSSTDVKDALVKQATKNAINLAGVQDTPNLLGYNGA
ncbi:vacuolar serine protease Isp6 [Schizosaccharomyces osmophilus]|uniref:Vacuolar serine protease Isp6 n=1 Tax=Schizosaccharomyces osmophilus TaxID=2545709 RepID=A0AAF0AVP3_9SCHI|nr:vacuolar serine protease Isp6 [Schizosaccharomyces osmophilus]WBW73786.1 vacuolar serine protease Isp6 [Schizosaccharomyces osmophilus]